MDNDERKFGDADARAEDYEARLRRQRPMWRSTDSDPYPDFDDDGETA